MTYNQTETILGEDGRGRSLTTEAECTGPGLQQEPREGLGTKAGRQETGGTQPAPEGTASLSPTHPPPHTPGFTGTGEGAELANCLPCASVGVHRYFDVRNGGGNREAQRG